MHLLLNTLVNWLLHKRLTGEKSLTPVYFAIISRTRRRSVGEYVMFEY